MPKKQFKEKTFSNMGSIKNIKKMFDDIMNPSDDNKHIYLEKIYKIHDNLQLIGSCYQSIMEKSLKLPASEVEPFFTETDKIYIDMMSKMKQKIEHNFAAAGKELKSMDNITFLLNKDCVSDISLEVIKQCSNYTNGLIPDCAVQKVMEFCAEILQQYHPLTQEKLPAFDKYDLSSIFEHSINKTEKLMIMNTNVCKYASKQKLRIMKGGNDEEKGCKRMMKLATSIHMLYWQSKKLYDLMNIPEIDIEKMRDLIEQGIKGFEKKMEGCDKAFSKLYESLNIFIKKFDEYYKKYLANGKDPVVFFTEFIEDIKTSYQDKDSQYCRDIIRQFEKIQEKFGEQLTETQSNPQAKQLHKQLCQQISYARKLLGTSD